MLWESWLVAWRSWTATSAWREEVSAALWKDARKGVSAVADAVAERLARVAFLERMLSKEVTAADEPEQPPPTEKRA